MMMMACAPVLAAALAWPLPKGKRAHPAARAAQSVLPEVAGTDVAE